MLNFCDFIQVFVFTPNHHLNTLGNCLLDKRINDQQFKVVIITDLGQRQKSA